MPFALAPALVLLLVLMAGLLIPLIRSSTFENRWAFPAGAAAMAIVFFALAGMRSGFDKNRRQSNHVLYLLDAAAQRARWLSLDARPDEWTEQFFGKNPERGPLENSFPLGRRPYLQSAAPSAPLEPPELQVLEDEAANDVRRLRFRLVSPRGAERLSVQITCAILSVAVEGKRLTSNAPSSTPETRCSFLYVGLPKEGIELVLETRATSPVAMRLVDESYGLPALDGAPPTSRPAHMMPAPFFRSDFSLVSRDFSF
jgi:hypothetical protein